MRNVPYQPLLLSLLAVLGATGCGRDHEKDVSYVAGESQLIVNKEYMSGRTTIIFVKELTWGFSVEIFQV